MTKLSIFFLMIVGKFFIDCNHLSVELGWPKIEVPQQWQTQVWMQLVRFFQVMTPWTG
jgi:hypothetical protein